MTTARRTTIRWATLDPDGRRQGSTDADEPVVAASLIKLPVLLAVLRAVDAGDLRLTDELPVQARHRVGGSGWITADPRTSLPVSVLATAMIDSSDNAATNVLLDTLGYPAVDAAVEAAGLRSTALRRHMMDAPARAAGRENVTSAADACSVLFALTAGTLLSPTSRAFATGALLAQRTTGRLTECVPDGLRLAHKTGELDGVRHDAGVLLRGRTVVAALAVLATGDPGGEAELDAGIVTTGRMVCNRLDRSGRP